MNENALALIENENAITYFNVKNGLDPIIEKIKEEVKCVVIDISTKKGREECASLAHKIAKTKTAIDKRGKDLVADMKSQVKLVDAERSRAWDEIEKIQHEVRKPLTDWEEADKIRISAHEFDIKSIEYAIHFSGDPDSIQVQERIDSLKRFHNKDWQEFSNRATLAIETATKTLTTRHSAAVQREREKAELERLRREEAERKQREHEDKLKTDAAEKARKEAEATANKKAEEEAMRVKAEQEKAEKERIRLEAEKKAETERAEKSERDRIAAEEKATKDAEAAKLKAENDAKVAAEKAEKEKQTAIQAERDRVAAEKKSEADELAKREADKAHRARINNEAMHTLLSLIFSDDPEVMTQAQKNTGKMVIAAIAKGEVPHVKINY